MNIKITLITISLFITVATTAQNSSTLNYTDQSGKKQGHWIVRYSNGNKQYEGNFKDDQPIDTIKRFYEDAQLRSIQLFGKDGAEVETIIYHKNGFIASEGKYLNQKKTGIWKIYSANFDRYLISEENYLDGKRNDLSLKYYPDGAVLERLYYNNDEKNGEWTQFYSNGMVSLKAFYSGDKLEGPFEVFFTNGKHQFKGQYKNDTRDGDWTIYNEDGTVKYNVRYNAGITEDSEMYRIESDYLDELEKNRGNIAEPDINDIR